MKSVYIKEFGGPEVLEIRDVAEPGQPGEGQILVRVLYSGVNRADLLQRRGLYPGPEGFDPHRPGLEFAGVVESVGAGVLDHKLGDNVMGITSGEAQSELIVVDQRLAVPVGGLDIRFAGAIPEVFVTAHDALVTQAAVKSGETVLIHAAASGVGIAAAQIAKASRARVIGTTRSPEKRARLLDPKGEFFHWFDDVIVPGEGPAFADKVIKATGGRGADVIIDLVGGAYFPEGVSAAALYCRIILVGLTAGRTAELDMGATLAKRLTIKGTVLRSRSVEEKASAVAAFRSDLMPLFMERTLVPVIDRVFPIEQVAEAHEYVGADKNIGKVLLSF